MDAAHDPHTLPEWLRARAAGRTSAPALRHKRRGVWHVESWAELAASVEAAAAGLRRHGFAAGDRLLVDAPALADAFRVCLAAWWLGGEVLTWAAGARSAPLPARFALAGSEAARDRVLRARLDAPALALGVQLEGDPAWAESGSWCTTSALGANGTASAALAPAAAAGAVALQRLDVSTQAGAAPLTHAELVERARAWTSGAIVGAEEALAGQALSLGDQLETVIGAWLVAGFTLSFAEAPATEHGDRRELEPSLLFDAADGYAALAARIDANLPPATSRERRWLERAFQAGVPGPIRRLVTSRVRAVVGLRRVRQAVVVDGPTNAALALERLTGLRLQQWPGRRSPALGSAALGSAAPPSHSPLARLELASTGSDVA